MKRAAVAERSWGVWAGVIAKGEEEDGGGGVDMLRLGGREEEWRMGGCDDLDGWRWDNYLERAMSVGLVRDRMEPKRF